MQTTALLAGVENHRVGQVAGDGGLAKIVRTFHARFGSVKTGAGQTPRQRIAYVRREGQHADDAGDVEATAGDKEKVLDTADRLEAGARIKRGPTADRLLATQVIELPAESTPEQRAKCAQAFVDDWRERGHQAIATVHVHGEERKQPHLHVEIAARPMGADGEVDRSVRLWRGKPTIYAERQKVADLVNEHCEPDPPYHPGGFRDIGREGDTPKKRIPARPFRDARAGIRQAREALAVERAEMIGGAARVVSEAKRETKREAHEKRTVQIVKFKKAGLPARPSQRAQLERQAVEAKETRDYWNGKAGEWMDVHDRQRLRADTAEAGVATLTDEKQQAETRAGELEAQVRELTERQTKYVTDWHADREVEPPDLATVEGQSEAWANMRAWEIEERKRRKDEAVAKKAEIEEIARERDEAVQQAAAAGASPELVERAERAEAERDALATGLGLTPEQVAQAARRAEAEQAKAERQAREQAAAALQPHCMPIWRAHLATSKRLADAVFDEGAEAAEALVRDPDRAGTVLANPDLSGVEELVAAVREADASRPRRTLTLQERADRSESAAAAEAERAHAAELERDRAQEAGREARGKLSEREDALRDVTRQRNDARAALENAGIIDVQAAEEAARKQRTAKAQAEAEAAEWRRLDELRSRWTRERQAREKYGYKREEMEGKGWSSDADMARSYKHQFDQEARLIEVIDRKSYASDDDARDRTEAVAVQDLLYEFAGKRGVNFGHGVVAPAWRIGCDVFLDHARTVAHDENLDRTHVAFSRVAGAPELVYDREQERWDYRHPEQEHSYWMKAEDAAGWEAAARIAHYASVRDALKRSEPVPDKVLADYPDLAPKPQQDKPKTPPTPEKEQQPGPANDPQKDPPSRKRGGIGD